MTQQEKQGGHKKAVRIKKGRASAPRALALLLCACWLIPLLTMASVTVYNLGGGIGRRTDQLLEAQNRNMAQAIARRIDDLAVLSTTSRSAAAGELLDIAKRPQSSDANIDERDMPTRELLSELYDYRSDIRAAFLVYTDNPDTSYFSQYSSTAEERLFYENRVRYKAVDMAEEIGRQAGFLVADGRLYLIRCFYAVGETTPYAILSLHINTDFIDEGMETSGVNIREQQVWFNDALLITRPAADGQSLLDEATMQGSEPSVRRESWRNSIFYVPLSTDYFKLRYGVVADTGEIQLDVIMILIIAAVLAILLIPLVVAALLHVRRNLSAPLKTVEAALRDVEGGRLGAKIDNTSRYASMKSLAETFNGMSAELADLFNRAYVEKLAQRDVQIAALKTRINPEFIGSTLEHIHWQASMTGDTEISETVEALARVMDAALNRGAEEMVTIREDMIAVDAYMLIMKKRFSGNMQYVREVRPETELLMVPGAVISPLVENAVQHGIEPLGRGSVIVRATQQDGVLTVEVLNDGKPLTGEARRRIDALLSRDDARLDARGEDAVTGIRSIDQRIHRLFGDPYKLEIYKDENGMTVSRLTLPVIRSKASEAMTAAEDE